MAMLFGFKGAPLIMGRLSAAIGRLVQSLFHPAEGQTQVYIDDVALMLRGSQEWREIQLSKVIYVLSSFGVQLSMEKGERGRRVVWIGKEFEPFPDKVVLGTPRKIVEEGMGWEGHDPSERSTHLPGQTGLGSGNSATSEMDGDGPECHPHQGATGGTVGARESPKEDKRSENEGGPRGREKDGHHTALAACSLRVKGEHDDQDRAAGRGRAGMGGGHRCFPSRDRGPADTQSGARMAHLGHIRGSGAGEPSKSRSSRRRVRQCWRAWRCSGHCSCGPPRFKVDQWSSGATLQSPCRCQRRCRHQPRP